MTPGQKPVKLQPQWVRLFATMLALTTLATFPALAASEDSMTVEVSEGLLKGRLDGQVREFLGIPYAAAPVGNLRWKPPQPAVVWAGTRDATRFASKCPQMTWSPPFRFVGSEDCLFLNVYGPKVRTRTLAPVLVWFHGGGWVNGSSQDVDGHVLASKGVVVVTVNYRLGAMGFFASPALDAESPSNVSGNFALLDEQAALRWVQKNIRSFGADARRVTIAGQSAGALSNWIHLVAPSSWPLFHRVIGESPVASLHPEAGVDDARGVGGTKTLREEETQGPSAYLAKALGCDEVADQVVCLRSRSAEQIVESMKYGTTGWGVGWTPVVDGVLLSKPVPQLLQQGLYKRVPILTGGNWGENGIFSLRKLAFGEPLLTRADYERAVLALPRGLQILAQYPAAQYPSAEDAYNVMRGDARVCTNISTARVLSKYSPLYVYEFEDEHPPATLYDVEVPPDVHPQSFHTAEIAYVFQAGYPNDLRPGPVLFSPAQKRLSEQMLRDWVAFVTTGRPPAASRWAPFSTSNTFQLLSPEAAVQVPVGGLARKHNCPFWFRLWPY